MSTLQRRIRTAILAMALTALASTAQAAIYMEFEGIEGNVSNTAYDAGKWFVADSFSFGVEREMKESGEKLVSLATIRMPLDANALALIDAAMAGESIGDVLVQVEALADGSGTRATYLKYELERCFVKSWSTSVDADGQPTEEVVFVIEAEGVSRY